MSDDQITIKIKQTNNNQTFDVTILKSNTILELKLACKEKSQLDEAHQNLVYKGRILVDDKLVEDYNLGEGHTVILVKKITQEEKDKRTSETNSTQNTLTSVLNSHQTNQNLGTMSNMFSGGMPDLSQLPQLGGMGGMDLNQAMNMLSNPQYQQMMSQMLNNPMMLNMILESPQLKPMLDSNPQLRAMFSNPQTLQAMLNPEFLQNAINRMGGMGGMNMGTNPFGGLNLNNTNTNTSSNLNPESPQDQSSSTNPNPTTMNNPFLMNPFMFGGLGSMNSSVPTQTVDPKEKYKEQNERLKEMGFINDELNFQVLTKTGGNVDAAVERLLNMLN